jgi:Ni,Fe-hydrogenase III large subunit
MIHDLWGHTPEGATDLRPWLDHGAWPQARPLSPRPAPSPEADPPPPAALDGDDLMLVPKGPVWGDRQEPAQLCLTLDGPVVQAAEVRLGYAHKGTLSLMRGKSPRAAARFAARLSGDATVAHALAFALAAEAATETPAPPRAVALRVVMSELERIAGHLDSIALLAATGGAEAVRARCLLQRERLLRACATAFGHRLMMDCVIPGGVAADLAPDGGSAIRRALGEAATQLPLLRQAQESPSLSAHLVGACRSAPALVAALGVGGIAGRAAGRGFDARTLFVPGYAGLSPRLAMRPDGDAAARLQLRLFEIEESVRLVSAALAEMPDSPLSLPLPQVSGEGIGCAESIRGDVWHWLRLDHGQIAAAFARDPGWALWPLAQHVLRGAAEQADLVRASFGLPASGMDL